jgi:hypothetical protein
MFLYIACLLSNPAPIDKRLAIDSLPRFSVPSLLFFKEGRPNPALSPDRGRFQIQLNDVFEMSASRLCSWRLGSMTLMGLRPCQSLTLIPFRKRDWRPGSVERGNAVLETSTRLYQSRPAEAA